MINITQITRAVLLCSLLMPMAARAEQPMTAAEFKAYTTGKTLTFASTGAPYGAEEYSSNQRVMWTFLDGECLHGYWFSEGADICFVYETWTAPQCWNFFQAEGGLTAKFVGDADAAPLYELKASDEPLNCQGPKFGT